MSLTEQADALRAAFQAGKDDAMLTLLIDDGMRDKLIAALRRADERTLTYSAPHIADLAKRLGQLGA